MKESCCQFGEERRLAGVLTKPARGAPKTALILVSAGLSPRPGPFRLYVELARRLARDGRATLRFDLGDLGDSQELDPKTPLPLRTAGDLRAAVDHLSTQGSFDDLIIGGLCSGAEDAFRYAESDPRVTGVLMIDPFAYRTPGFFWRDWLVHGARHALSALRLYRLRAPSSTSAEDTAPRELVDYRYLERAESGRILESLVRRDSHLHFIYTGGMSAWFNHPGQLRAMFRGIRLGARTTVDHLPRLGHTQLLASDREELIETIARRLRAA